MTDIDRDLTKTLIDLDDLGAGLPPEAGAVYTGVLDSIDMVSFWTVLGGIAASVGVSLDVFARLKSSVRHGSEGDVLDVVVSSMTKRQKRVLLEAALEIRAGRTPGSHEKARSKGTRKD